MPLTDFQRRICRLTADSRIRSGVAYVAGAAALNELTRGRRLSRDIDVFHDTEEAVAASWDSDRALLRARGYEVHTLRERPGFVEAEVRQGEERVLLQWARDSAYRFFPLATHPDFGLTLHPFDLATNKVLALIGRVEARDWIDVIHCHDQLQPLGYLAWAACGKDPGFSPAAVLEEAARASRYTQGELDELDFTGTTPRAADLSRRWHAILDEARALIGLLPAEQSGTCVLAREGGLYRGGPEELPNHLTRDGIVFHGGRIGGALPRLASHS